MPEDVCVLEGPTDLLRRELCVSRAEAEYERVESSEGVDAPVFEVVADTDRVPLTLTV